jgi:sugar-specific transcriptional regulator TrmB
MLEKSQASFLGLDKKEIKILSAIQQSPKSMFVISNEVNIPRATLYPIVEKLSDRGFIHSVRKGQRVLYQLTPTDQLVSRLSALIKELEWNIASPAEEKINGSSITLSGTADQAPIKISSTTQQSPIPSSSQKKSNNWFKKLFKR